MKNVLIILLLMSAVNFGCEQEQHITQLEVGRSKLLDAGLALEAVGHLERAEQEEINKVEPRALLLIAYSHGLSTGSAKASDITTRYQNERNQRLIELNDSEIKHILQLLNERYRVQKDAIQILVDKGSPAVPVILESLVKNRYRQAHEDLLEILKRIGPESVGAALKTVSSNEVKTALKIELIRTVAAIGDAAATEQLETLHSTTTDEGLRMEINTALHLLGNTGYEAKIIAGLSNPDVTVRRAAARSIVAISNPPLPKMIAALQDTDDTVRRDIAKALKKHPDATAVDNLIAILTDTSSLNTKQAASDTLKHYAQNGLADGLAAQLVQLLINTQITNHEGRLQIVQLLKKNALLNQIEAADPYDNLPSKLYDSYDNENNSTVKGELSRLLLVLDQILETQSPSEEGD